VLAAMVFVALLELLSSPHAATKAANEAATPVPPAMRRNFFREVGSDASSGTALGASGICIAPLKLSDALHALPEPNRMPRRTELARKPV
jgi:hypothetical protein